MISIDKHCKLTIVKYILFTIVLQWKMLLGWVRGRTEVYSIIYSKAVYYLFTLSQVEIFYSKYEIKDLSHFRY